MRNKSGISPLALFSSESFNLLAICKEGEEYLGISVGGSAPNLKELLCSQNDIAELECWMKQSDVASACLLRSKLRTFIWLERQQSTHAEYELFQLLAKSSSIDLTKAEIMQFASPRAVTPVTVVDQHERELLNSFSSKASSYQSSLSDTDSCDELSFDDVFETLAFENQEDTIVTESNFYYEECKDDLKNLVRPKCSIFDDEANSAIHMSDMFRKLVAG